MTERQAIRNPAMMVRLTTHEGSAVGVKEEWYSMKRLGLARGLAAVAIMAIVAGACSSVSYTHLTLPTT